MNNLESENQQNIGASEIENGQNHFYVDFFIDQIHNIKVSKLK